MHKQELKVRDAVLKAIEENHKKICRPTERTQDNYEGCKCKAMEYEKGCRV